MVFAAKDASKSIAFDNSQLHSGSGYVADQSGYGMVDPSQHYYPVLSSSTLSGPLFLFCIIYPSLISLSPGATIQAAAKHFEQSLCRELSTAIWFFIQ